MHSASIHTENRFGHKAGINIIFQSDLFYDQSIDHGTIGHGQGISIFKVYFMLAGCHFMMAVLHGTPISSKTVTVCFRRSLATSRGVRSK